MKEKFGNILDATEDAIIQQCNCVARKPHGLSQQIAQRFPHCRVYSNNTQKTPGTIEVYHGNPTIICLLAQYGMGKPHDYGQREPDSYKLRLRWFQDALDEINPDEYSSVAIPYKIGCGLAGGNWNEYLPIIEEFDKKIPVTLYIINQ